jgi:hypothetical protein
VDGSCSLCIVLGLLELSVISSFLYACIIWTSCLILAASFLLPSSELSAPTNHCKLSPFVFLVLLLLSPMRRTLLLFGAPLLTVP